MIEVKSITKKYGESIAIKDISFSAKKGEIIGLLGPNGAGKTTTLNILTGYLKAIEGTVLINGIDINNEPEKAKANIGYLPDIPPLYPEMTIFEYLKFVAELRGVKKSEINNEADKVMKLTKTETIPDKLIKTLSKGYKQRVGLAQAIIGSPKIIILDEPSSGLDPKQIIEMRDIIKTLGKKHTVILSSHILHEVSTVCDRIIIISKGSIVASGSMDELSERVLAGSKIFVKVKGNFNTVNSAFAKIESASFAVSKNEKNGICDAVFKGTTSEALREKIFDCAAQNGLKLIELTPITMSLEDIFLEVI
ncbi:MAG: ABC transporter ATP-binding protein [Defluviitaleaceae bacterium]|nr:ABC transporter ATP-binding protein [Defluviitaleaceae bacterium]